jgi:hypothetical protein
MPKNRKRTIRKGAKSISVRTKHKIGGRKSSMGTNTMSNAELEQKLTTCRKRDKNKLRRAWEERTVTLFQPGNYHKLEEIQTP